uniref:NADH dehydrogenase subunit 4L n=1 Tax=Paratapes undulatus TaxID=2602928 RepID=H6BHU9_9BIVA|nr:NADH dehydrogenase subunit 4L [Paratapes undulatus]AEH99640.1 NADH dehydrogenase subunit 4L [Paratapes undulatus]
MFVFFSLFCVLWQEKFFLNVLLLYEFFMLSLVFLCIYGGMMKVNVMVAYTCIMILCLDVSGAVLGLALLVNSSRMASKKSVLSFSFLSF